jgi:hypothetical protein
MTVRLRRDELGYLHIHTRTMKRIQAWLGDGPFTVEKVAGRGMDSYVALYSDIPNYVLQIRGYVACV